MEQVYFELKCPQCSCDFRMKRHAYNNKLRRAGYKIYCSRVCYIKSKVKLPTYFICKMCGKNIPNTKGCKKIVNCSRECYGKSLIGTHANRGYKWTEEQRRKLSGKNSPLWRGGVTESNKILRSSKAFKDWRKSVFERDNYTCQECLLRGGELHPDHIKPFAYYPELRFELSNGRTLCAPCHRKTDTYGYKALKTRIYGKL